MVGLAFLLFLAGLEIDLSALRGALLRAASLGFAISLGLAVVAGLLLDLAGIADEPLLIAIILASTSLGVIVPVLQDSGEISSRFGQLVIAAASIADFASVLLLTLLFSGRVDRDRREADPDRALRARDRCGGGRRRSGGALGGSCRRRWSAFRTPAPRSACEARSSS